MSRELRMTSAPAPASAAGDGKADAAARTGDQRPFSREAEERKTVHPNSSDRHSERRNLHRQLQRRFWAGKSKPRMPKACDNMTSFAFGGGSNVVRRYRPYRACRHGLQPGAQHRRKGLHRSPSTTARPRKIDDFMATPRSRGSTARSCRKPTSRPSSQSIKRPRSIIIMVKAGQPVDEMIEQLLPMLEAGDAILECGNSLYTDTQRRFDYLQPKGIGYLGIGVSGGEEGARHGPSIMVGGAEAAVEERPADPRGDLGQVQRRAVLRLSRRGRRRPLRQDDPQRHRIWRHADDRRSLWRDARRARHEPRRLG